VLLQSDRIESGLLAAAKLTLDGEYFAFVCSLIFECDSHGVFTFFL
jgi:hypothetical protein